MMIRSNDSFIDNNTMSRPALDGDDRGPSLSCSGGIHSAGREALFPTTTSGISQFLRPRLSYVPGVYDRAEPGHASR
jgi:hypothetical protein